MSKAEYLKPKGLAISPAYSHVAIASGARTIYIAGQVSIDEKGAIVGAGDLAAQTEQVMRNIERCLVAAGATFEHVVKITTFVVNYTPELRAIIAKARSPFFADRPPPASSLVGVSALAAPEWMIEIEAIAVVD
jgi:enamine deaminase RidA (YjgF/YER057c/UK114 family)